MYKMGEITRQTGLRPETIRGWERRFDFLRPQRSGGRHRIYGEDDLLLLHYIARQQASGRSIGVLAHLGRDEMIRQARTSTSQAAEPEPTAPLPRHRKGLEAAKAALIEGAVKIDSAGIGWTLDALFAENSPEAAIESAIVPALTRVGELWDEGVCSISGEHLLSGAVRRRIMRLLDWAPSHPRGGEVLLACLPDEWHEIGALIHAWRLQCRGWRTTWLGASLPIYDLIETVRWRRPKAVVLSVTLSRTLEAAMPALRDLRASSPEEVLLVLGGPGTAGREAELEKMGYLPTLQWEQVLRAS